MKRHDARGPIPTKNYVTATLTNSAKAEMFESSNGFGPRNDW